MNIEQLSLAATICSGIAAIKFIWRAIDGVHNSLYENPNQDTLALIKEYCNAPHLKYFGQIAISLQKSFETKFGLGFSLKFLKTSAAFSLISVVVVTLLWSIIKPEQYKNFLEGGILSSLAAIVVAAIMLNLIPDILSLWQTSKVVKYLKNPSTNQGVLSTFIRTLSLVLLDVIITISIALFVLYLYSTIHAMSFSELARSAIYMDAVEYGSFSVGIFFYTTFATTLWINLWLIASFLMLSESIWNKLIRLWTRLFDISDKPYTPIFLSLKTLAAIGIVTIILLNKNSWIVMINELAAKF